ncbi:hypothetical protein P40081_28060 [Paenibacillus sp. FSL P4-0081]|uniref:ABC transporter permease n=1 Tax=unclassified Paenibacillus TaxID=185978 RepID=UPI0004F8781D|nr:ABC transporter permease [Paenibacillus sp. FSL P4-0081]AIQ31571.1 hypothetical protein P40081_28060 [Paenibacillus sp. FSL P4-0081]
MSAPSIRPRSREFTRVLSAELSKLWSLPFTWLTLVGTFIVNIILSITFTRAGLLDLTGTQSILDIGLTSVSYAQSGFMIFGILAACSEYTGGQIRTTLTAMPRRGIQLVAVLFALTIVLIPTAIIVSSAGLLLTASLIGSTAAPVALGNLVTVMIGVSTYLTLTALISAAVGIILRRSLPSVAAVLGYYFIAGPLLRDQTVLAKYLPDTAGLVMWFPQPDDMSVLTPIQGAIFLSAWLFAAIIIAATVYRKRDM